MLTKLNKTEKKLWKLEKKYIFGEPTRSLLEVSKYKMAIKLQKMLFHENILST